MDETVKQFEPIKLKGTLEKHGLTEVPVYRTAMLPVSALVIEEGQGDGSSRKNMVNNIKTVGVLQNLLVLERTDGKYTVISGNRRLSNAIDAKLTELECHIYPKDTSEKTIEIMRLSENVKRSPNWPGQVYSIRNLINKKVGMTHAEIAKILGISVNSLAPLFKLAALPDAFIKEMQAHRLPKDLALQIAKLGTVEQKKLLGVLKTEGEITPEQVKIVKMTQFAQSHPELVERVPEASEGPVEVIQKPVEMIDLNASDWLVINQALTRLQKFAQQRADRPARITVTLIDQINSQIENLVTKEVE